MPDQQPLVPVLSRIPVRWRWIGGAALVAAVIALVVAIMMTSAQQPNPGVASPSASPSGPSNSEEPEEPSPSPGASELTGPSNPTPSATPIDAPAEALPGVQVQIVRLEAVEGTAQGPGEVAGPAVRFAVVVTNSTSTAVSLQTVVITVDYGSDRTPASELAEPGGSPLPGRVAPGQAAEGVYIFTVPIDQRDLVRITVDYSADVAPVVFEGAAPR